MLGIFFIFSKTCNWKVFFHTKKRKLFEFKNILLVKLVCRTWGLSLHWTMHKPKITGNDFFNKKKTVKNFMKNLPSKKTGTFCRVHFFSDIRSLFIIKNVKINIFFMIFIFINLILYYFMVFFTYLRTRLR